MEFAGKTAGGIVRPDRIEFVIESKSGSNRICNRIEERIESNFQSNRRADRIDFAIKSKSGSNRFCNRIVRADRTELAIEL